MKLETIDREYLFQGFKGVSEDGVFREMNRTRATTGQKNTKRFVSENVFSTARRQRQMIVGKCQKALKKEPSAGVGLALLFGTLAK